MIDVLNKHISLHNTKLLRATSKFKMSKLVLPEAKDRAHQYENCFFTQKALVKREIKFH